MKASYLGQQTRPEIVYTVNVLAEHQQNPNESDERALERLMRYLRGTWEFGVLYRKNPNIEFPLLFSSDGETIGDMIEVWADANYAEETGRKSRSGHIILFAGAAIDWFSKKQSVVALSSTESEYYSLSEAVRLAKSWRYLFGELMMSPTRATRINEDNQSTIALAHNPKHNARVKHFDVKAHHIRDEILQGSVTLVYCPTEDMIADILTKALPPIQHWKLVDMMGMASLGDLDGILMPAVHDAHYSVVIS